MNKYICIIILLFSCLLLQAQDTLFYSTNRSTQYGIGATSMLDTYLSPLRYSGMELRITNESNRLSKHKQGRLSIQNRLDFSFARAENPAGNATEYAAFFDWNWGYHYRFPITEDLKLLAGGLTYTSVGAIYNLRNGNNPVSAKIGLGVAASGMALYNFRIREQPLTARLQLIMPVAGFMFAPKYGQSYYDLFGLGNYDNNVHFSSFHNLINCKSILSVDVPLNKFTIRATYQYNAYLTNLNQLKTEVYSHTFLIGFVSEIISIKGKKQHNTNIMQSAYY